jgi:hypothetical protein
MFRVGESIDPGVFDNLVSLLVKKPLAMNPYRLRSGKGRSQAFGLVYQRNGRYGGSRQNFARIELFQELLVIARKIIPTSYTYDGIQLNQNYRTAPHKDTGNRDESAIIGFGSYLGGDLNVDGSLVAIKNRLVFFDGSKHTHSTEEWTGERFSLVFYKNKDIHAVTPLYQVVLQSDGKLGLQEDLNGVRRIYNKNGDIIHASDGVIPAKKKAKPYLRFCIPAPTTPNITISAEELERRTGLTVIPEDSSHLPTECYPQSSEEDSGP